MALSQSIANGAPVLPNDVAFWEHEVHYHPDRYYGGVSVTGSGAWSLNTNCNTQHRSSIRSDTKFWLRDKNNVRLTTFREIDSSIPEGTNLYLVVLGILI